MNAACERALSSGIHGGPSRKYIEAILKRRQEQQPTTVQAAPQRPVHHENVRGGDYYDREEAIH